MFQKLHPLAVLYVVSLGVLAFRRVHVLWMCIPILSGVFQFDLPQTGQTHASSKLSLLHPLYKD